ncbi:MAG: tripartite tricarboxylate transporter TctB family protein [Eubacteriales bacterium]|nr:tripartite tricarboxylate transporter TctB family protein [Eubacteriales bacterium]
MKFVRFFIKRYLFALLALIFVIVYWISAHRLPEESIIFPRIITYVTIPLFIWVFATSVKEYKALLADESIPEEEKWNCTLNLSSKKLVIIAATVLYVALVPVVGYCVTTILYVGGLSYYLGNRKPVSLIVYTLVFFGILYAIFGLWLRVRLPSGFLF